jgi:hypothetical protein
MLLLCETIIAQSPVQFNLDATALDLRRTCSLFRSCIFAKSTSGEKRILVLVSRMSNISPNEHCAPKHDRRERMPIRQVCKTALTSTECGHYYPDVLRVRDEKRQDGSFVRIIDCEYCGRYAIPLDLRDLAPEVVRELRKMRFGADVKEKDLTAIRKKERKRFSLLATRTQRLRQGNLASR